MTFQDTRDRGGRRGRVALALAAAASLAAIGLLTIPAGAQTTYEILVVEAFNPGYDLREVYVWDINESSRACGTSTHDSFYAGFVWTQSTDKTLIPIIWAEDINNLDQIAGDAAVHDFTTGVTTYIPGLNATFATPYIHGLNDVGTVVGHAKGPGSDSDGVNRVPIVWDAVNGTRGIGVAAARELLRVNNANVAVGNIRWSAGDSEAFVHDLDTGTTILLEDLLTPTGPGWSEAAAINESGVVAGEGWNGTATHAFLWSEADGFTFLPGLNGGETMRVHPRGLNEERRVVGSALDGLTGSWRAFSWDVATGMVDLNDLVDAPGGFVLDRANQINDAGVIVGDGHFGPGWNTSRGFVLIPNTSVSVPEPGRITSATLRLAPGTSNPAHGPMAFEFDLRKGGNVRLTVYDVLGRSVASLVDRRLAAGRHTATWDARSVRGSPVPSGAYFVRLESPAGRDVRRVVQLR